jgi:hypothetical protein
LAPQGKKFEQPGEQMVFVEGKLPFILRYPVDFWENFY